MIVLTMEYVEKNKLTPVEIIKHFKTEWTDEECDFYLWEFTCFPFSTEILIKDLNRRFMPKQTTN